MKGMPCPVGVMVPRPDRVAAQQRPRAELQQPLGVEQRHLVCGLAGALGCLTTALL
jgi:hypothetical protein